VQQYQRIAFATFNVVKPNAIDFQKLAPRRIVTLGSLRKLSVYKAGGDEQSSRCGGRPSIWV
jgi:hypothetical protein